MARKPAASAPTQEIGAAGVSVRSAGYLRDPTVPELSGREGARLFRLMRDTDATAGAVVTATELACRAASWGVEPPDDSAAAKAEADRLRDGLGIGDATSGDMSHSWGDFVSDALTMAHHGWSYLEVVWKVCLGPDRGDAATRSGFDDGRVMPRKLVGRDQLTLSHWQLDPSGGVQGMWQALPDGGPPVLIPIERALLFRTTRERGSPEGRSILKSAYQVWREKLELERVEGIGIRRDLAGVPIAWGPGALFRDLAGENVDKRAAAQAKLDKLESIVQDLDRASGMAGVVLNSEPYMDADGKFTAVRQFGVELIGPSSQRSHDVGAVVGRKVTEILRTTLCHFLALGTSSKGALSLSKSQTDLFLHAVNYLLDVIADVANRFLVPRIWALNGLDPRLMPAVTHTDATPPDLAEMGAFLRDIAAAGVQFTPSDTLESWLRRLVGAPELTPEEIAALQDVNALRLEQQATPPEPVQPTTDPNAAAAVA